MKNTFVRTRKTMDVHKKVFMNAKLSHLFSYLVISILPVVICVSVLAINNVSDQKQRLDGQAAYGLQQFNDNYRVYMEIMDACSGHLEDRIGDGMTNDEIPAQLLSHEKNYPQFASVFYFEKASNYIYTSTGKMDYHGFEKMIMADYGVDLAGLRLYSKLCYAMIDDTMVSDKQAAYSDGEDRYLFYLKVLPELDPAPKSVMVFMLPIHTVLGRLDEYVPKGYSIYSYSDRYLSYIVQKGESISTLLQDKLNRLQLDTPTHADVGGENYLLLRVQSSVDGTIHMLAYRESTLYEPVYRSMRSAVMPILSALILTIGVALYLHWHYYRGIEQILKLPFQGGDTASFRSPYAYIVTNTKHLLSQNQQMVLDIRQHNVSQILKGLFHGNIEDMECIPDEFGDERLRTIMTHPQYTAAYISGVLLPEIQRNDYVESEREWCSLWMISVCGGTAAAVLINHEHCAENELTQTLADFLCEQHLDCETVGIGQTQEYPEDVQISLMQAQVAARSGAGLRVYSPQALDGRIEELMPIAEQRMVCNCIRSGDDEAAVEAFERMIRKLQNVTLDNCVSYEWYLFMLESILSTLREELQEDIVSGWDVDRMIHLYSGRNDERFKDFVRQLAAEVRKTQQRRNEARQNEVAAYVAQHILDPDLSLEKISDAFGLSKSAIVAQIQESTEMTFAKYVTHCKMEYVCTELSKTNRQIKDIIAEVGYLDVSNFTRKFRLKYGCTPSAYREGCRLEE